MKGAVIDLKTAQQPTGLFLTPSDLDEFIEENADLYHEQVMKISREYGGRLITDKRLHWRLYLAHAEVRVHDDKVLEILRFPDFPAEEFYCIQLGFVIKLLEIVTWKWFFFRRPRGFRGVQIGSRA